MGAGREGGKSVLDSGGKIFQRVSRLTGAIEQDEGVRLELEIGTDLGCTVRGLVRRSPVGGSKEGRVLTQLSNVCPICCGAVQSQSHMTRGRKSFVDVPC